MSDNSLKALDWNTLVCFVKGLVAVAKVDGIQPKEREYIEAFYQEEIQYTENNEELDFETLYNLVFDKEEAKNLLNTDELKRFFLKSCIMLACVDEFTSDERSLIKEYAEILNVNSESLDEIINEVQQEILNHFKDIKIYTDSLKDVAERIGITNLSVKE